MLRTQAMTLFAAMVATCFLPVLKVSAAADDPIQADYVLKGGSVIDGTGAQGIQADLAILGDRIVAVGAFEVAEGAEILDVEGLIVAPGFIDLHSHSDRTITRESTRPNRNFLAQGVTTIVTGNCGSGPIDVAKYLAEVDDPGAGTNVIHLIPHGTLRRTVMGTENREATPEELEEMKALVKTGMEGGAWGMSTGLIYIPSQYSTTEELIELSKVVAEHGGIYASHIRGEGTGLLRSIEEAITIGKEADLPVHISHLKASGKAAWGLVVDACAAIGAAREAGQAVSADQYPYVASSTSMSAMVIPESAVRDGTKEFVRIADDPEEGPKLRQAIERRLEGRNGGESIRVARYSPKTEWVGLNLAQIAEQEKTTPVEIVIEMQRNGGASGISFGMSEDDVRHVMQHEFVATASDGSAHNPGGSDRPHPRSYGTFPRKIRYALDEGVITLEQAIRANAGLPAEILGLTDRGILRPEAFADIVVFDPQTFRDTATFDNPTEYAVGVQHLFVNGELAIKNKELTNTLPGQALRLKEHGQAPKKKD